MVRAIAAFINFCYLVRRSVISEETLREIDQALACFHCECEIFRTLNIRGNFNLPRQHSLTHYRRLIQLFGAPNGLCSSITENKHIKAVKEPWRRSNRHNALGQMLVTNQRLDRLAAARRYFATRGLTALKQPNHVSPVDFAEVDGDVDSPKCIGEVKLSRSSGKFCSNSLVHHSYFHLTAHKVSQDIGILGQELGYPNLRELLERFLYDQLNPNAIPSGSHIDLNQCPQLSSPVHNYRSAIAMFYAPSDISGIGGMHRELIRATPSWFNGPPCYDCVIVEHDPSQDGFRGLHVARIFLFLSFTHEGTDYPCAFIQWFSPIGDQPCEKTGMWIVQPDTPHPTSIIHIDSIL
jgi:hypothetical protein